MSQNIINIPYDTYLEYRVVDWKGGNSFRYWNNGAYKIFGRKVFGGEEYYYIEKPDYDGSMYFMIKVKDLLPYIEQKGRYVEEFITEEIY